MIFVYKNWEKFCKLLDKENKHSITAENVLKSNPEKGYVVLKHDVETNVQKAYELAKIESKYKQFGTYYVQAYLLQDEKNIALLSGMQAMGHEVSYHYDVLDSSKGDMEKAEAEFEKNLELFRQNGFNVSTVCQHGNPVVERIGYTSNRDFFRNEKTRQLYPDIADIMVDFKEKANTEYLYFSDAGRRFKLIYDPINNDRINSDDKNIAFGEPAELIKYAGTQNCIISTHPHRWSKTAFEYYSKLWAFKLIKAAAKLMMKIPGMKKLMSRYYYLAKKI